MQELLLLFLISATAWAAGLPILRHLGFSFASAAGLFATATSLGLGMIAYLVLFLGLLGQLSSHSILTTGLAGLALEWLIVLVRRRSGQKVAASSGCPLYRRTCSIVSAGLPHIRSVTPKKTNAARMFRYCLIAIACLGTLVGALAPPTAGDALCYHLEIPKRFVQLGSVCYLPLTDNSLFPFLMEMLYTLSLLWSGPVLAQLMHWLVGLLLALAVFELAIPIVGKEAATWAGTITLLVPGITNQMAAPLNDLATALYCTLMLVAWMNWNRTAGRRWLVLSGVFAGLAISAKLVAAGMVLVMTTAVLIEQCHRKGAKPALMRSGMFVACALVCGGIWYLRSWYHTGNPIYPYFNGVFGGEPHTRSLLRSSCSMWQFPWAATMYPEHFGGRGHQYGAVFLALLPGLALIRRPAGLVRLLLPALAFGMIWFAVRQDLRFLLSAVPPMAVAAVAVIQGLKEVHRPAWLTARVALAVLLSFQSLIVLNRAVPRWAVALGLQPQEAYLERHEPSYRVARFVNTQLPSGVRLISQDYRGFYFEPEFVREAAMRRQFPYRQRGDELVEYLAGIGFTHALLVQAYNPNMAMYDQSFTERLGPALARLPVVFQTHYEGPNGDRRDYQLLALPPTQTDDQKAGSSEKPRFFAERSGTGQNEQ